MLEQAELDGDTCRDATAQDASRIIPDHSDTTVTDTTQSLSRNDVEPAVSRLMHSARVGDLEEVKNLLSKKHVKISDVDSEGATALHWAASYNQYAVCKLLIDQGADVNAIGGESRASPGLWAAHKRHYYVVGLLLRNGADTALLDFQGFNMLHLSTFGNCTMQAILLLHYGSKVDAQDSHLHTSLMWAAYNGFPQLVNLYLRWGASVDLTDESGSTALHWALVKGDFKCVQKLVEFGSNRFAATNMKKTPAVVAHEMNTTQVWERALKSRGYRPDGQSLGGESWIWSFAQKHRRQIPAILFLYPFIILGVVLEFLSSTSIFVGIPAAIIMVYGSMYLASSLLKYSPAEEKRLPHTTFLAGVFSSTLFWVGVRWLVRVLPGTLTAYLGVNCFFIIAFLSCAYFYFIATIFDPGYVPKTEGLLEQKGTVDELIAIWRYDEQNFCVHCMTRRPLRSKHCFACKRCVAKHDHHCPWINNCVAVNNHRQFILYVVSMELGIGFFLRLIYAYFSINRLSPRQDCYLLSPELCGAFSSDPFTAILSFWTALQAVWATMLVLVQVIQIARAQTTYENMKSRDMFDEDGQIGGFIVPSVAAGAPTLFDAQLSDEAHGPNPALPRPYSTTRPTLGGRERKGWFGQCTKLLGVDTFVVTAQHGLDQSRPARRQGNPFSRGALRNLLDFITDPAPVFGRKANGVGLLGGVELRYTELYETPLRTRPVRLSSVNADGYVSVDNEVSV